MLRNLNGNRLRSNGNTLRFGNRRKFGVELRQNGIPSALHRALQVDRLHAKHGQQAAAREQTRGTRAASAVEVFLLNLAEPQVFSAGNLLDAHKIAMQNVLGFGAENVSEPAGHAGTEIQAQRAENQDHAAGHVFAPVLADAFDDRQSPTVSDGEAFTRAARDEQLAGSRAIQDGIARQDIATAGCVRTSRNGDAAAGEAFRDVVVRFAVQLEVDAGRQEGAETLACAAAEILLDGPSRILSGSAHARKVAAQARTDAAVGIPNQSGLRFPFRRFRLRMAVA